MKDVLCAAGVEKGEKYTRRGGKKKQNRPECGCELEINISRYANE
jgi:hypothetical protein